MLLLLDENLPKRLKLDSPEHEMYTVREKGWNGITNGRLMALLIENKFNAFLSFDKNLQHQQNFSKYPFTVFILPANINSYDMLTKLSPKVKVYLGMNPVPEGVIIIS